MENTYDVIIIGSGPAGLTAGIYTGRGNRKTLLIAGRSWGGQLMLTTEVENFPGFPEPIMGPELMQRMREQTERYGTKILDANFVSSDFIRLDDDEQNGEKKPLKVVTDDDKEYYSKSVIIATGADTKWLQIPGEKEHIGRGVSSCAPCDAAFYRNRKVVVVGGGDSAMEEALVLTKFASEVFIVHRREEFRASDIMQKKVFENEKITVIWNTEPLEIMGEMKVEKLKLKTSGAHGPKLTVKKPNSENTETSIEEVGGTTVDGLTNNDQLVWEFPIDGVFVAIGHIPNSKVFPGIDTDEKGFIKVYDHTKTNMDGVYVAGDVHDHSYMQAVTAAGFGCQAALEVEKYLQNLE